MILSTQNKIWKLNRRAMIRYLEELQCVWPNTDDVNPQDFGAREVGSVDVEVGSLDAPYLDDLVKGLKDNN